MATIHTFTGNEIIATEVPKYLNDNFSALNSVDKDIKTQLGAKAPLASPTLTGTPKAPTASQGTNTTQIATTAFVASAVKVKSVNGKTGDVVVDLPVGHMYWSVEPNVPTGRLPAMGATYNRALYADLWAWANSVGLVKSESEWQAIASANDGNCAYYSSGDGSTTFRVPKLPNTIASDVPSEVPVVGNGKTLGLNRTNATLTSHPHQLAGASSGANYIALIGTNTAQASYPIGVATEADVSGIVAKTSATKITGQWLIVAFGVAHNIGEADVANVMQAVEQVQTSVGTLEQGVGTAIDYIVESYRNGTEWYEVYKSGKVRQGGKSNTAQSWRPITLSVPMANTDYNVQVTSEGYQKDLRSGVACSNVDRTTTSLSVTSIQTNNTYSNQTVDWIVEGQGA